MTDHQPTDRERAVLDDPELVASIKRGVEEAKAGLASPVDWSRLDSIGDEVHLLPAQDPELNARVDTEMDRYMRLHDTTDAAEWASAFMALRFTEVDEGLLIGWFANAIAAGHDEARRRWDPACRPASPPIEAIAAPIELTKKPTTVRAIQWTGSNLDALRAFAGPCVRQPVPKGWLYNNLEVDRSDWDLELLAGVHGAQGWVPVPIGHWIFGGPGDFWPVANDYVTEHYEVAS